MKRFSFIAFAASVGHLLIPMLVAAAEPTPTKDYLLVENLPFVGETTDIATYLQGIFNLGLGLAVTFAILMIVVNGIKYMVSDAIGAKIEAKDIIKNALVGLLIIFGSVLILNTINPQLTSFNLQATIDRTVKAIQDKQPGGPDYVPPPSGDADGNPWPSDSAERSRLQAAGININKGNCAKVGDSNCTSVHGLSESAIAKLINLKTKCNCTVTITGGTEHWLHSTHGNFNTVDLSATPDLNAYLGGAGSTCKVTRVKDGANYRWEDSSCPWAVTGSHWHVTY